MGCGSLPTTASSHRILDVEKGCNGSVSRVFCERVDIYVRSWIMGAWLNYHQKIGGVATPFWRCRLWIRCMWRLHRARCQSRHGQCVGPDHIFPAEILEIMNVPEGLINHPANLRPLHHANNEAKSILYPKYTAAIVGAGKQHSRLCIRADKQKALASLYNKYITRFKNSLHATKILYGELSEDEQKVVDLLAAANLMN